MLANLESYPLKIFEFFLRMMGFEWVRGGAQNPLSWQESHCRLLSPSCNLCWGVTGPILGCENVSNQKIRHVSKMTEIVHVINATLLQATFHPRSDKNASYSPVLSGWCIPDAPKKRMRSRLNQQVSGDMEWQQALSVLNTNTNLFVFNYILIHPLHRISMLSNEKMCS